MPGIYEAKPEVSRLLLSSLTLRKERENLSFAVQCRKAKQRAVERSRFEKESAALSLSRRRASSGQALSAGSVWGKRMTAWSLLPGLTETNRRSVCNSRPGFLRFLKCQVMGLRPFFFSNTAVQGYTSPPKCFLSGTPQNGNVFCFYFHYFQHDF